VDFVVELNRWLLDQYYFVFQSSVAYIIRSNINAVRKNVSVIAMNECQLTVEPFFQCCCQCKYRIVDHYKHTAENHEKGLCFKPKGWICCPPYDSGVHSDGGAISDWEEHSCGCEMFNDRRKK
jgi:hypothetical protein